MATPNADDRRRMQARALEWRTFRKNFLFSQVQLAEALKISRRCVQNVERQKVVYPRYDVQMRFLILKRKHMLEHAEFVEASRRRQEAKIEAQRLAALTAPPSLTTRRYKVQQQAQGCRTPHISFAGVRCS